MTGAYPVAPAIVQPAYPKPVRPAGRLLIVQRLPVSSEQAAELKNPSSGMRKSSVE